MTTKAASTVKPAAPDSIESIAYESVAGIPTVEPHDRDRLGFNVWRVLTLRQDSLEHAVRSSGSRILIGEQEAVQKIRSCLAQRGFTV